MWTSYKANINTTISEYLPEDVSPADLRRMAQDKPLWEFFLKDKIQLIHEEHLEQIKEKSERAKTSKNSDDDQSVVKQNGNLLENMHVVRQNSLDSWIKKKNTKKQ